MATITVNWAHPLPPDKVKAAVERFAQAFGAEYRASYAWRGDEMCFTLGSALTKGVTGSIAALPGGVVSVRVALTRMLVCIAGPIQAGIEENLAKELGGHRA